MPDPLVPAPRAAHATTATPPTGALARLKAWRAQETRLADLRRELTKLDREIEANVAARDRRIALLTGFLAVRGLQDAFLDYSLQVNVEELVRLADQRRGHRG